MSLIIPDAVELEVLTALVTPALTMKLYGNNKTPAHGDTSAGYTEIAGGGYAAKALTFPNWEIVAGEPTNAVYDTVQNWTFTGILTAPGTIYGYYIVRDSDNFLMCAERFPVAIVPFSPIEGSIIKILPKLSAQSQF